MQPDRILVIDLGSTENTVVAREIAVRTGAVAAHAQQLARLQVHHHSRAEGLLHECIGRLRIAESANHRKHFLLLRRHHFRRGEFGLFVIVNIGDVALLFKVHDAHLPVVLAYLHMAVADVLHAYVGHIR